MKIVEYNIDEGDEMLMLQLLFLMQGRKWHQGSEAYGKVWQKGDVIGCMIDMTDKTISKLNHVFQRPYLLSFYFCICQYIIVKCFCEVPDTDIDLLSVFLLA